jgi:hypothetical protein
VKHHVLSCALLGALASSRLAAAQRPIAPIHGVVFDSLRGQPLRDASVMMTGAHGSAISTDERGRFQFDSVSPGVYTITVHHAVLDSIGVFGLSAHATITDGETDIHLAVPSFATLWRAACGAGRVPADSGIVYGTVRDVRSGAPVVGAAIVLSWRDLLLDHKTRRVLERKYRIDTRTNANGGYAVCGVVADLAVRLRAASDSAASGTIKLLPSGIRVLRHDLAIGPVGPDPANRGSISGIVSGSDGEPIVGAHVQTDSLPDAVTDTAGRFTFGRVPSGSAQFDVLTIGSLPTTRIVDVVPGETTHVAVQVQTVVTLDGMRTTAAAAMGRIYASEFTARRTMGFGYSMDSTTINGYNEFVNVLQSVPSLTVHVRSSGLSITVPDGEGGSCAPDVLIDGAPAANGHLLGLFPHEIAGLEVYATSAHVPSRFARVGIQSQCGMILVWTKYGFRNR